MSEEAEKPVEGAEAKKKSKLVPMIGSGVVVIAGAVAALWYLGMGPFAGAPKHAEATAAVEGEAHGEAPAGGHGGGAEKPGGLLSLEPFIANLADDGGR